jgi:hypothetical protein
MLFLSLFPFYLQQNNNNNSETEASKLPLFAALADPFLLLAHFSPFRCNKLF